MRMRIVTPEQLEEGYVTYANGSLMRHSFHVISRRRDGNYVVREPGPVVPLDASCSTDRVQADSGRGVAE